MSLTPCPYCTHGNPANAKFCNECGGTLSLAPCPHCGAVNEVGATACHQCRKPLTTVEPENEATLAAAVKPGAAASTASPWFRGPVRFAIIIALLATMAVVGYLIGRLDASTEAAAPASGSTASTGRSASTDVGRASSLQSIHPPPSVATHVYAPVMPPAEPHVTLSLTPSSSLSSPGAPSAARAGVPPAEPPTSAQRQE